MTQQFLDAWNELDKSSSNIFFFFSFSKESRSKTVNIVLRGRGEEKSNERIRSDKALISSGRRVQISMSNVRNSFSFESSLQMCANDTRTILSRFQGKPLCKLCFVHRVRSYLHRARLRDIMASGSRDRSESYFTFPFSPSFSTRFIEILLFPWKRG